MNAPSRRSGWPLKPCSPGREIFSVAPSLSVRFQSPTSQFFDKDGRQRNYQDQDRGIIQVDVAKIHLGLPYAPTKLSCKAKQLELFLRFTILITRLACACAFWRACAWHDSRCAAKHITHCRLHRPRALTSKGVDLKSSSSSSRSKTRKRLKERFLIGRNRTKRANFRGSPLFQATYNNTTENCQTNLCQFDAKRWREDKSTKLPNAKKKRSRSNLSTHVTASSARAPLRWRRTHRASVYLFIYFFNISVFLEMFMTTTSTTTKTANDVKK